MSEQMYLKYGDRSEAISDREKAISEGAIVGPLQYDVFGEQYLFAHMGWREARDE